MKNRKHNRVSIRLRGYDYASAGAYFITICTWHRKWLFGDVLDGKMHLNSFGRFVDTQWMDSFQIRKEIMMDTFIVMPNHVHGIVWIVETGLDIKPVIHSVGATGRLPQRPNGPPPRSISSFVAGFKSACTKQVNHIRNTPGMPVWQRGYYDHIIRNDNDLSRIRKYIVNNPLQWQIDRNCR